MSTRTSPWPAGTPCWVDLAAPDPPAAFAFYAGLLGWQVRPGPLQAGGYRMATLRASVVAGIRPASPGTVARWTTYLAADHLDAALREVVLGGGDVVAGPMSVLSDGAIALARDPCGVPFGLWQRGELVGAELVNEPGAFCWAELLSPDLSESLPFFSQLCGYSYRDRSGDDFSYAMVEVGGTAVAAAAAIGPSRQAEPVMPPQWLVYFSVDDTDAAAARAISLGGRVEVPPTETPHGRMSLLHGRAGELFGVLQADDLPRPPAAPA